MVRSDRRPRYRSSSSFLLAIVITAGAYIPAETAFGQWPQWGGPNRNFIVDTSGLADKWPEDGPKQLWHRKLGYGYSAIAYDDGVLYTMYRRTNKDKYESVVALNATTGETIWRKRNLAVVPKKTKDYGKRFTGPNASPLVVGDRLFTVGRNALLHCWNKSDGTILWKHKLDKKFGAQLQVCGYSNSPLAYRNSIILPMGREDDDTREGSSLVSFDQETGEVLWKTQTFQIEHSSPIMITLDGEEQLVQCTKKEIIGINPQDGSLIWKHPFPSDDFQGLFASPVWNGKDTIFFSSRKVGCAIKLAKGESGTASKLLWSNSKSPFGQGTPVLVGGILVGPKNGRGMDASFMAVNTVTGEILWQDRAFPSAVTVGGGGRIIVLDHNGNLGLATVTSEGMTVLAKFKVAEKESFTSPILVGTTLYIRDEKNIMAFDLGEAPLETKKLANRRDMLWAYT